MNVFFWAKAVSLETEFGCSGYPYCFVTQQDCVFIQEAVIKLKFQARPRVVIKIASREKRDFGEQKM